MSFTLPKPVIAAIEAEVDNAIAKFPANKHLTVALMEEVGELAQAQLQGLSREHIVGESVQVIATAVRIILEGDADLAEVIQPVAKEHARVQLNQTQLKDLFTKSATKIEYSRDASSVQASITVEGVLYAISAEAGPLEAINEAALYRALWDEVRTKYYA